MTRQRNARLHSRGHRDFMQTDQTDTLSLSTPLNEDTVDVITEQLGDGTFVPEGKTLEHGGRFYRAREDVDINDPGVVLSDVFEEVSLLDLVSLEMPFFN